MYVCCLLQWMAHQGMSFVESDGELPHLMLKYLLQLLHAILSSVHQLHCPAQEGRLSITHPHCNMLPRDLWL